MDYFLRFITTYLLLTCATAEERITRTSPSRSLPLVLNDETVLICEMNIVPDNFQWKFYPLPPGDVSNPNAMLRFENGITLPSHLHSSEKRTSKLTLKMTNTSVAGDYQCLAQYGASTIAVVPDRITVSAIEDFPRQESRRVDVVAGNTISWKCDPPFSNPPAYIDYYKSGTTVETLENNFLVLSNVTQSYSGYYTCQATNTLLQKVVKARTGFDLRVENNMKPRSPYFITSPRSVYVVKDGDDIFLDCAAVGNPPPRVTWTKTSGFLPPNRTALVPGGLKIRSVSRADDGVYICTYANDHGKITHSITLIYNSPPKVVIGPQSDKIQEGKDLELSCEVEGIPRPTVTWLLNGESVKDDKNIEAVDNRIYINKIEKRHAGIFQCFAVNMHGVAYGTADLELIPKQVSSSDESEVTTARTRKNKHGNGKSKPKMRKSEMIPPNKPTVHRISDESVMIRWTVPKNDGLGILFFKVQYREVGSADRNGHKNSPWVTSDKDIPQAIRTEEITNLKPEHWYRFRIAAVFTNNDSRLSPKSDKFFLERLDFENISSLPIPRLTHTEMVNETSIRIYWEIDSNSTSDVDGYIINYISASSAGDYNKVTVDGTRINNYIISHLEPDTYYDIKMQSFDSKTVSEFTPIMKQKTAKLHTESPPVIATNNKTPTTQDQNSSMYIFIGVAVIVAAFVILVIVSLFICRKWKQSKDSQENKPTTVDELNHHHIPADVNDYVVSVNHNHATKNRSNGIGIAGNRMTITANPLADADNKNNNHSGLGGSGSSATTTTTTTTTAINDQSTEMTGNGVAHGPSGGTGSRPKHHHRRNHLHRSSSRRNSNGGGGKVNNNRQQQMQHQRQTSENYV